MKFGQYKPEKNKTLDKALERNEELQRLVYRIHHDAYLAEAARAKGLISLINMKKDEINDKEVYEYLNELDRSLTNMRKKMNEIIPHDKQNNDFVIKDF